MVAQMIAGLTAAQFWIIAYVVVTMLAAFTFILLGRRWIHISLYYLSLYIFIVVWSGLMYLAYLWDTPLQQVAWYIDWFVTLPLLVLALGLTAYCRDKRVDWSFIGSAIGLQLLAVTAGMMAIMVPSGRPTIIMFTIGAVFMGWLLYLLWNPLMRAAGENSPHLHYQYYRLVVLFSVLVVVYPLLWLLSSPVGIGLIPNQISTILLIFIVPVLMKPVFGLLNLWLLQEYADTDSD